MRTIEEYNKVKELAEKGLNKSQISRETGVPRGSVNEWLLRGFCPKAYNSNQTKIGRFEEFYPIKHLNTEEKQKAYSHILAVYLCDGYINEVKRKPGVYCIRFFNDYNYPIDSEEWRNNLKILLPGNSCNLYKPRSKNIWQIMAYSKNLAKMFPQHGLNEKWQRKMILESWQKEIITKYPEEFIRGCIQSDGSIYPHVSGPFKYKAYSFVNKSEDIMDWFLYTLSLVYIKKEKYYHKTKELFVCQSFNEMDLVILESIISKKQ